MFKPSEAGKGHNRRRTVLTNEIIDLRWGLWHDKELLEEEKIAIKELIVEKEEELKKSDRQEILR